MSIPTPALAPAVVWRIALAGSPADGSAAQTASDPDAGVRMLGEAIKVMQARSADLVQARQRRFEASADAPELHIIVDEVPWVFGDGACGEQARALMRDIAYYGRTCGVRFGVGIEVIRRVPEPLRSMLMHHNLLLEQHGVSLTPTSSRRPRC